jgi:hypothetical protein
LVLPIIIGTKAFGASGPTPKYSHLRVKTCEWLFYLILIF